MSITEVIEDEAKPPLSIRVRQASLRDYEELCALFDQLDEIHRLARPDMFQPFPPPARTRGLHQIEESRREATTGKGLQGSSVYTSTD